LPPRLTELIAEIAGRKGLWASEREDIRREIEAHFLDGLRTGLSEDELADSFGDPRRAARLMVRGKRRARPLVWKVSHQMRTAIGLAFVMFCALYTWSAIRLYTIQPRQLAPYDQNIPPAEHAQLLVAEARQYTAAGHSEVAASRLASAVSIASHLRDQGSLERENSAFSILNAASAQTVALLRKAPGASLHPNMSLLDTELRAFQHRGQGVRVRAIRATLDELIARMYASNGRLTGRGLHLYQAMRGKTQPGFRAIALEPLYFLSPADAAEVDAQFKKLTAGTNEIDTVAAWPEPTLRMPPMMVLMPALRSAVERARLANDECRLALHEIVRARNGQRQ
jgi:HAAS